MENFTNWEIDLGVIESLTGWGFLSALSPSIRDIIDILLVTFIAYKIIVWVKHTKVWTLFKGASLVLIVSGLAFFFKLTATSWLINNFLSTSILALLIIFQPELRKMLEELGKGKFSLFTHSFGVKKNTEDVKAVNEILRAAELMSKDYTGALIVIEKQLSMVDIENTGTRIGAEITAELLLTIFMDKTPLHDGAVLIRDNKLVAASCILPLTEEEIGKEYGTRHRAAVGANETYQCVVVIVSEETGAISVVVDGVLNRGLSVDKARELILGDIIKESAGEGR